MSYAIQSNSIRGDKLRDIADRTVEEILANVKEMLGPGASDAFIVKDDQTYYTRDGKEVLQSLYFDNELSNKIHHIFFQAAHKQGTDTGDGSTTLTVLYCYLYQEIRWAIEHGDLTASINVVREKWKNITSRLITSLAAKSVALTEENMLSMFYTCTQDAELSAKLFRELKDPVLAGAYIVPRVSNIATDFRITTYNRPVIKATRLFSIRPIADTVNNAVVFYCNGMLDIAHADVLAGMAARGVAIGGMPIDATFVILCHGVTEATRRSTRTLVQDIKRCGMDVNRINNVAIYTMDDYRKMEQAEIEDLATILSDEPGLGGMVNALTFENYLYHAFEVSANYLNGDKIDDLETFDVDIHIVDKMKEMCLHMYEVMFDDVEGMAIGKEFGPVATARYNELRREIEEEKSSIRKFSLNKRLRRSFGMFIDIEVGSSLLKDSQRKYELILDAILSGSTAAQEKVLIGNSIIHALREVYGMVPSSMLEETLIRVLKNSLILTLNALVENYTGRPPYEECMKDGKLYDDWLQAKVLKALDYDVEDFTFSNGPNFIWPKHSEAPEPVGVNVTLENGDGSDCILTINPKIIEPFGSIKAILTNSVLPVEVAMTKVFHISARTGYMQNFLPEVKKDD